MQEIGVLLELRFKEAGINLLVPTLFPKKLKRCVTMLMTIEINPPFTSHPTYCGVSTGYTHSQMEMEERLAPCPT